MERQAHLKSFRKEERYDLSWENEYHTFDFVNKCGDRLDEIVLREKK